MANTEDIFAALTVELGLLNRNAPAWIARDILYRWVAAGNRKGVR